MFLLMKDLLPDYDVSFTFWLLGQPFGKSVLFGESHGHSLCARFLWDSVGEELS